MAKKKSKDTVIDVSGSVRIDSRGKVRNPDEDQEHKRSGIKKKRKKDDRKERLNKVAESFDDAPKKKRKRVDADAEVPKKKKDKSKLNLPATSAQLAKLERRREKATRDLAVVLEAEPGDEFDRQYREMFANLQHIISMFEERMLQGPTGRDVYALSTLYSQMREVIADIRASKDVSQQIAELESQAYSGFLRSIGQSYVDIYFHLQKDIRQYVKDVDAQEQLLASLKGVCKDQGDIAQASYQTMLEKVRTVLM